MQKNLLIKPFLKKASFLNAGLFIITLDQVLKYLFRRSGKFYLCNEGISFGVYLPNTIFWLILVFFLLIVLLFYILQKKDAYLFTIPHIIIPGISLFVGGAISNIIDRLTFGCVLDYISIFKIFPTFNLADVGIFLGSCFILYFLIIKNTSKS